MRVHLVATRWQLRQPKEFLSCYLHSHMALTNFKPVIFSHQFEYSFIIIQPAPPRRICSKFVHDVCNPHGNIWREYTKLSNLLPHLFLCYLSIYRVGYHNHCEAGKGGCAAFLQSNNFLNLLNRPFVNTILIEYMCVNNELPINRQKLPHSHIIIVIAHFNIC